LAFLLLKSEDFAGGRPGEVDNFIRRMVGEVLDDETDLRVVMHLVNVNTVSFGVETVVTSACVNTFLGEHVNGELAVVGLPVESSEFVDFALNGNLLLGNHIAGVQVETLNLERDGLLVLVLVLDGEVVALGVEVQVQAQTTLDGNN